MARRERGPPARLPPVPASKLHIGIGVGAIARAETLVGRRRSPRSSSPMSIGEEERGDRLDAQPRRRQQQKRRSAASAPRALSRPTERRARCIVRRRPPSGGWTRPTRRGRREASSTISGRARPESRGGQEAGGRPAAGRKRKRRRKGPIYPWWLPSMLFDEEQKINYIYIDSYAKMKNAN